MRPITRLAVLTGAAGALVATSLTPAVAAGQTLSISSYMQTVTTSTGKTLKLSITASKAPSGTAAYVTVSLSTGLTSGEFHRWSFSKVAASSLTYSASTGKGSLKTGTQLSPYGKLVLNFVKTSQSKKTCSSGSTTTIKGTLKGIVHFVTNTGSRGWGNVGSATRTFTFRTPNYVTLSTGEGCGLNVKPTCMSGVQWTSPTSGSFATGNYTTAYGMTTGSTSSIFVNRSVKLSKPAGAMRFDNISATGQPKPTVGGGVVSIRTKSGTPLSGSARLTEGSQSSTNPDSTCVLSGVRHTQHSTYYYQAAWSSPSTGRFKANYRVTADYTAPSSGSGTVIVYSYT